MLVGNLDAFFFPEVASDVGQISNRWTLFRYPLNISFFGHPNYWWQLRLCQFNLFQREGNRTLCKLFESSLLVVTSFPSHITNVVILIRMNERTSSLRWVESCSDWMHPEPKTSFRHPSLDFCWTSYSTRLLASFWTCLRYDWIKL